MDARVPLSPEELDLALAELPGWTHQEAHIVATFQMPTFALGIDLVSRAAVSAEAANHHPDIDVRWRSVTFRLGSHDVDAITIRDVNLARRIQAHAQDLGWAIP
jgi:4a-hydroxytetrahydrobiopterin dehydratase